jgi:hypothetical protein
MATYKINVTYTFEGYCIVEANSKEEAIYTVDNNFGFTRTEIQCLDDTILNWDFPIHPDKKIDL